MNDQLESLNEKILDLVTELKESKDLNHQSVLNKLLEFSGDVDSILEDYEKRLERVNELLL